MISGAPRKPPSPQEAMSQITLLALAAALTLTACETTATVSAPTRNSTAVPAPGPSAASTAIPPTAPAGPAQAATAQVGDLTSKPFKARVAGAASVKVTVREMSPGGPAKVTRAVDVKDAKGLAAIMAALGPDQTPRGGLPRCPSRHELIFLDGAGKQLATVGLCDGRGLAEPARSHGRIDLPDGQAGSFEVADLRALRAALKPHDIELP